MLRKLEKKRKVQDYTPQRGKKGKGEEEEKEEKRRRGKRRQKIHES